MSANDNRLRQKAVIQLELLLDLAEDIDLKTDLKLALHTLKDSTESTLVTEKGAQKMEDTVNGIKDLFVDDTEDHDYDDYYDDEEDEEEYVPILPNGFNTQEEYQEFLESQREHLTVERTDLLTGETHEDTQEPIDVAGVVMKDGQAVDVGNFDESLEAAHEALREGTALVDEETDETIVDLGVDEIEGIRVRLTRGDNQELSANDVARILDHPQARPMIQVFGEDFRLVETEDDHVKDLVFTLDEDNEKGQKASQVLINRPDMMSFAGTIIIPAVGAVSARVVLD